MPSSLLPSLLFSSLRCATEVMTTRKEVIALTYIQLQISSSFFVAAVKNLVGFTTKQWWDNFRFQSFFTTIRALQNGHSAGLMFILLESWDFVWPNPLHNNTTTWKRTFHLGSNSSVSLYNFASEASYVCFQYNDTYLNFQHFIQESKSPIFKVWWFLKQTVLLCEVNKRYKRG